jgi:hypothetical protein
MSLLEVPVHEFGLDSFGVEPIVRHALAELTTFARPGRDAAEAALRHWRSYHRLTATQCEEVIAAIPALPPAITPAWLVVEAVRLLRAHGHAVSGLAYESSALAAAQALLTALWVPPPGER